MLRRPTLKTATAAAAKTAFGAGVFLTTVGCWAYFTPSFVNMMALPDSIPDRAANRCALWFVGSSSIARWQSLPRDIPGWQTHNRGIRGAQLDQIAARTMRTSSALPPAGIVLYAGENDIASGASGLDTAATMMGLIDEIAGRLPSVPIFVVSLKPSPERWAQRPEQLRFNAQIAGFARNRSHVTFVAAGAALLRGGRPDPGLYDDGVHLNAQGYAIWSRQIRAAIDTAMPRDSVVACAARSAADRARGT